jgi:hypothetical protein
MLAETVSCAKAMPGDDLAQRWQGVTAVQRAALRISMTAARRRSRR